MSSTITEAEKDLQTARRNAMNLLRSAHLHLAETPEAFEERTHNDPWRRRGEHKETKAENEDLYLEHAVDAVRDYVLACLKLGI